MLPGPASSPNSWRCARESWLRGEMSWDARCRLRAIGGASGTQMTFVHTRTRGLILRTTSASRFRVDACSVAPGIRPWRRLPMLPDHGGRRCDAVPSSRMLSVQRRRVSPVATAQSGRCRTSGGRAATMSTLATACCFGTAPGCTCSTCSIGATTPASGIWARTSTPTCPAPTWSTGIAIRWPSRSATPGRFSASGGAALVTEISVCPLTDAPRTVRTVSTLSTRTSRSL